MTIREYANEHVMSNKLLALLNHLGAEDSDWDEWEFDSDESGYGYTINDTDYEVYSEDEVCDLRLDYARSFADEAEYEIPEHLRDYFDYDRYVKDYCNFTDLTDVIDGSEEIYYNNEYYYYVEL